MQKKTYKADDTIMTYVTQPRLEIIGVNQCVVDGLKGISEYSQDKIKINLGKYSVSFFGDELFINSFSHQGAIVEGTIISVELESND